MTHLQINQIKMEAEFLLAQGEDRLSDQALKVQWTGGRIRGNVHVKIHFRPVYSQHCDLF